MVLLKLDQTHMNHMRLCVAFGLVLFNLQFFIMLVQLWTPLHIYTQTKNIQEADAIEILAYAYRFEMISCMDLP